jgi:hypothetical protein
MVIMAILIVVLDCRAAWAFNDLSKYTKSNGFVKWKLFFAQCGCRLRI